MYKKWYDYMFYPSGAFDSAGSRSSHSFTSADSQSESQPMLLVSDLEYSLSCGNRDTLCQLVYQIPFDSLLTSIPLLAGKRPTDTTADHPPGIVGPFSSFLMMRSQTGVIIFVTAISYYLLHCPLNTGSIERRFRILSYSESFDPCTLSNSASAFLCQAQERASEIRPSLFIPDGNPSFRIRWT